MLFHTIDFALFLPVVFAAYWLIGGRRIRAQNAFLVLASYFFYGYWDPRFLLLIAGSSLLDFTLGAAIERTDDRRRKKTFLLLSLGANLGLLAVFKYFGFFVANFVAAFQFFGQAFTPPSLEILLPVGISFYTFQTLSYTIDVYRGRLPAAKDPVAFFAYVSFFPQLVAGPIERAIDFLPQFLRSRKLDYGRATDGLRQILWGLVKKVLIADTCAPLVNDIFAAPDTFNGSTLLLGAVLFAFQIYGDFSGYSDIAIGTARLFGFNLRQNFAFPYFSRDVGEFWRRWHISLSTWFRDYLYIPLGGSRGGRWLNLRNVFIVFLVSGFWHGANWTFLTWGGLHALLFTPLVLLNRNRRHLGNVSEGRFLPTVGEFLAILVTFLLVTLAWVFFRAASIAEALVYLRGIFDPSLFEWPASPRKPGDLPYYLIVFLLVEWIGRNDQFALERFATHWWTPLRWLFYYGLVWLILTSVGESQEFIYFQF